MIRSKRAAISVRCLRAASDAGALAVMALSFGAGFGWVLFVLVMP